MLLLIGDWEDHFGKAVPLQRNAGKRGYLGQQWVM